MPGMCLQARLLPHKLVSQDFSTQNTSPREATGLMRWAFPARPPGAPTDSPAERGCLGHTPRRGTRTGSSGTCDGAQVTWAGGCGEESWSRQSPHQRPGRSGPSAPHPDSSQDPLLSACLPPLCLLPPVVPSFHTSIPAPPHSLALQSATSDTPPSGPLGPPQSLPYKALRLSSSFSDLLIRLHRTLFI